jgi:hypothetical protein
MTLETAAAAGPLASPSLAPLSRPTSYHPPPIQCALSLMARAWVPRPIWHAKADMPGDSDGQRRFAQSKPAGWQARPACGQCGAARQQLFGEEDS